MIKQKKIITVDDNLINLNVCKNILKPYYEVYPVSSAAKLFDLLERIKPDLILLDVEMPELDGYEAAKILKSSEAYKDIPVIFVTALTDEDSELTGRELGAMDYIFKPYNAQLLLQRVEKQLALAEQRKELREFGAQMQKKLLMKMGQVFELQNAVIQIVSDLVECRDDTTGGHIQRTQRYLSCLIDKLIEEGTYSEDTSEWDMDFLLSSAQLHDVGKIGISDAILKKPAKLTAEEFEIMKTHVQIGVNAIIRMEMTTTNNSFFRYAKTFAGMHHEKWDGTGYPNGLKGLKIPLEGRLFAIVDVYDALVSARPYKEAFSPGKAASIIEEGRGTHFDPKLVDIFKLASEQFAEIAGGSFN